MKNGSKICPSCRSKMTFEEFEMVECIESQSPCDGCIQLWAILAASARDKAAKRQPEQPEVMDLSPAAIERRLRAGRPEKTTRDWALAAAGDHE